MASERGSTASGEVLELMMNEGHFDKIKKEVLRALLEMQFSDLELIRFLASKPTPFYVQSLALQVMDQLRQSVSADG
jgi:hypothetical protein